MKKKIFMVCASICAALLLAAFYSAGCRSAYQHGYHGGYEDAYWNGRMDGQANSIQLCDAIVTGEFSASVLAVIPHADFAHLKPDTAVVTEFQSCRPFCVYVGEEIAESLETGGIYVFTAAEGRAEDILLADALSSAGPLDTPEAIYAYNLRIESVRPAEEGEYGAGVSHWLHFSRLFDEGAGQ